MIKTLLLWLDSHSSAYWWLGFGALGLVAAWSWLAGRKYRPVAKAWGKADLLAVALLFVLLLAWRWPVLLEVKPGSLAESRVIATAMAMSADLVPYRAADPGGEGLLSALVLLPTHWLGIPQDYFNARLVGLILDGGTLVVGYLYLRRSRQVREALLDLLPVSLILATYGVHAHFGYASWHLGLFLASLCGLLLGWLRGIRTGGRLGLAVVLIAAFSLGCLPWSSRPALLVAVVLWVVAVLLARRSEDPAGAMYLRRLYQVGAVALYGNLAMLCLIHGVGQWNHFWISYVCAGSDGGPAGLGWTGESYWRAGLVLIALYPLASRRGFLKAGWFPLGAMLFVGLLLVEHGRLGTPEGFGRFAANWRSPYSDLAVHIRAMRRSADQMVVWGDNAHLYVETGIRPGVSSILSVGEILDTNPRREQFRARYLAEMKSSQPTFFVDAGTEGLVGYEGRMKSGHEIFSQLAEYLNDYYRLESDDGQRRLYNRYLRTVADGRPSGTMQITLGKVRIIHSTGALSDMGEGRWLAHAPSRFAYGLPLEANFLSGAYGFIASAYADANSATDGATFLIEAVAADGRRELLLRRKLTPAANPHDRGPIGFKVEVPHGAGWQVEFTVEPGEGNGFDWTYWQGLECHLTSPAPELSK